MYFYSHKTGCCYLKAVHGEAIPMDAIVISNEHYQEVIANPPLGKVRSHDSNGLPILVDPAPPPLEEQARVERRWRDQQLMGTDGLVSRHRDELEEKSPPTLTYLQYAELQAYRRVLRSWPQDAEFPQAGHRPTTPVWLLSE